MGGRERGIAHKTGKQAVEEEESIFFRPALPVHCFGLVSLIFRVEMTEVRLSESVVSYKMEINHISTSAPPDIFLSGQIISSLF